MSFKINLFLLGLLCTVPRVLLAQNPIETRITIHFERNSTESIDSSLLQLFLYIETIKALNPDSITITGHSDNVDSKAFNDQLSLKRAEAIAEFLTGEGIAHKQLKIYAKGPENPIATNLTEEGMALNRRVELVAYLRPVEIIEIDNLEAVYEITSEMTERRRNITDIKILSMSSGESIFYNFIADTLTVVSDKGTVVHIPKKGLQVCSSQNSKIRVEIIDTFGQFDEPEPGQKIFYQKELIQAQVNIYCDDVLIQYQDCIRIELPLAEIIGLQFFSSGLLLKSSSIHYNLTKKKYVFTICGPSNFVIRCWIGGYSPILIKIKGHRRQKPITNLRFENGAHISVGGTDNLPHRFDVIGYLSPASITKIFTIKKKKNGKEKYAISLLNAEAAGTFTDLKTNRQYNTDSKLNPKKRRPFRRIRIRGEDYYLLRHNSINYKAVQ